MPCNEWDLQNTLEFSAHAFLHGSLQDSFTLLCPLWTNLFRMYYYHLPPYKESYMYFFKMLNIKISLYVANWKKEKKKTKLISYTLSSQNDTMHDNPKLTFVLCPLLYTYIGIHTHIYTYVLTLHVESWGSTIPNTITKQIPMWHGAASLRSHRRCIIRTEGNKGILMQKKKSISMQKKNYENSNISSSKNIIFFKKILSKKPK
jgi:hypothetical protein